MSFNCDIIEYQVHVEKEVENIIVGVFQSYMKGQTNRSQLLGIVSGLKLEKY